MARKTNLQNVGFFSRLLFLWVIPLFRKGAKQNLNHQDLYSISHEDGSKYLGDMVSSEWEKQLEMSKLRDKKPSLTKVLILCFGKCFLRELFILAANMWIIRIVQPICLQLLIRSFRDEPHSKGYDRIIYASLISFAAAANVYSFNRNHFAMNLIAMKCRVSCSSLIYRKILKLNKTAEGTTTVGHVVNLLANDANRFNRELYFLQFLFITPVQLVICFYLLWKDLGVSCTAGLLSILLVVPIQYYNGKLTVRFRKRMEVYADELIKIMSEIISSMRVIKMYAWEKPFSALVKGVRCHELDVVRKRFNTLGLFSNFHALNYKLLPFCMIMTYTLYGYNLTADIVFNVVLICTIINYSLNVFVNATSVGLGELQAAVHRIEKFLLIEERSESKVKQLHEQWDDKTFTIYLESASASWVKDKEILTNFNLEIKRNTFYAIIGPVGAGKSSLLQHLIGEMPFSSGKRNVHGKIAYAAQEAWIFDDTVRQNIIFGSKFDKTRYDEVTKATSLVEDFEAFPYGDLSRVGERGIILSGGQRARIGLARALYYEADIYLLDDPLSAVDSIVGKRLFEECLKKFLQNKTLILVTHQLKFLSQMDHIILLEDGKIACEGSYYELLGHENDFLKFLKANEGKVDNVNKEVFVKKSVLTSPHYETCEPSTLEIKQCGNVAWKTYWEYINSGDSIILCIIICVCFVMYQIVVNGIDYWLLKWTNAEQVRTMKTSNISAAAITNYNNLKISDFKTTSFYLSGYGGFMIIACVLGIVKCLSYCSFVTRTCATIHDKMLNSVMRAPIKFFDDNPSGRLLNRFTKDLCQIDEVLPINLYDAFTSFCRVVGVVIIVVSTNYFMILPSIAMFLMLWFLRKLYVHASKDLRRIEGITQSPVLSHVMETFQGLATIRAFRHEDRMLSQFALFEDVHSCAWFTFLTISRCFSLWIETISLVFVVIVTFSFIVLTSSTMGGNVGLAISSALSLASAIQNGLRQSAEAESLMMAVERTMEYSKLTPEAPLDTSTEKELPKDWPRNGHIRFENVSLVYGDSAVLKNISFEILPKEKVGIVGRTGAGKSSIIQSMFRMTEPKGDIYIDDVRVNDIGLHELRKSISIIPQDPVLFSGTIRYNLDPFEQFPDDELWSVINQVELGTAVESLDFKVSNGGNNFSVGQKQLVCLARAILRKNKIIIMDEATANVDHRTDDLIQKTIREKFSDCTIITIAHRIHSILNSDKMLVIDYGVIKECGPPNVLLQTLSIFSSLAENNS